MTGETSEALGEAEVENKLGQLRTSHRVLVADIDDNFILGMTFHLSSFMKVLGRLHFIFCVNFV